MVETLIISVVHPFWIITGLLPQRIALWVKIQLVLMSLLVGTSEQRDINRIHSISLLGKRRKGPGELPYEKGGDARRLD